MFDSRFSGDVGLAALCLIALCALDQSAVAQQVTATPIFYFPSSGVDGLYPHGGLIVDGQGRLYGTTYQNGSGGAGTVYRLSPPDNAQTQWTVEVLLAFDQLNGGSPQGGLTIDSDGNLYGDTPNAPTGTGYGEAYKLTNSGGWPFSVLHYFGAGDGLFPNGNLVFGAAGLLYGTTPYITSDSSLGEGTDFSLSPRGGSVEYHTINGSGDPLLGLGPVGIVPVPGTPYLAGVTGDNGTAYGTFYAVQANANGGGRAAKLYTFGSGADVDDPVTPPTVGYGNLAGSFFGCADRGGTGNGLGLPNGGIYQITPTRNGAASEMVVFNFPDPVAPYASSSSGCWVSQVNASGTLYGITGGVKDNAYENAFFELLPPAISGGTWTEKVLLYFNAGGANEPQYPWAKIGNSYYVAFTQGTNAGGVVLRLTVNP